MALAHRSLALYRMLSRTAPALARTPCIALCRSLSTYPTDRRYKKSHEWAKIEGDIVTVGITEHAQAALGDIVFADLPEVGASTSAGETAATIESVKAAADIYAPVGGEVVGVNKRLEESPDLINSEPHDDGWMFRVKVSDPSEIDAMMDADAYEKTLEDSD